LRLPNVKDGSGNHSRHARKTANCVAFPAGFAQNFPPNFFGALIPLLAFAIEESSFFDAILLELFGALHYKFGSTLYD